LIPAALILSKWLRRPYPAGKVGSIKEKNRLLGSLVSLLFSIERKFLRPWEQAYCLWASEYDRGELQNGESYD
jgi:hypothetical protein